jgi:hypothetical protein
LEAEEKAKAEAVEEARKAVEERKRKREEEREAKCKALQAKRDEQNRRGQEAIAAAQERRRQMREKLRSEGERLWQAAGKKKLRKQLKKPTFAPNLKAAMKSAREVMDRRHLVNVLLPPQQQLQSPPPPQQQQEKSPAHPPPAQLEEIFSPPSPPHEQQQKPSAEEDVDSTARGDAAWDETATAVEDEVELDIKPALPTPPPAPAVDQSNGAEELKIVFEGPPRYRAFVVERHGRRQWIFRRKPEEES